MNSIIEKVHTQKTELIDPKEWDIVRDRREREKVKLDILAKDEEWDIVRDRRERE